MSRRVLTPVRPVSAASAPIPAPPADDPVDILARTLWGEARGEPVRGIEAVAAVVMNRVARAQRRGGWWWGDSVVAVCRKPYQFSCWNVGDPNRAKLLAVTADDPVFAACLRVARRAVSGLLPDPTGGATHYHRAGISPAWARGHGPSAEIGHHLFYNSVE
ncbi:cell wall hydrolase [Azospirillum sp. SYSU D00513]|uniref:cell wall hydrolase n=1 Tax=Azospirillum sp. SYSU D00513 TaxID=2812561 RepID=UPI001A965403|nr:cell wall hydrolase [Azospirillum sp. SYSU D00513]